MGKSFLDAFSASHSSKDILRTTVQANGFQPLEANYSKTTQGIFKKYMSRPLPSAAPNLSSRRLSDALILVGPLRFAAITHWAWQMFKVTIFLKRAFMHSSEAP